MKNFQILIILIVLIAIASLVQKNIGRKENKNSENKSARIVNLSLTLNPAPTKDLVIKKNPTPAVTKSQNSHADIDSYKYPNSQIDSSSGSSLYLSSTDDPLVVTNWYKDKLKYQNMNASSFVQTNSNGNILDKLVSSNGSTKVSIEISKKNSENLTKIKVEI